MDNMIKINGIWVPTPGTYSWSMSDLDASAERNAEGILIRERVRSGVRKLQFSWNTVPDANKFYEFISMLDSLPPEFEVTYPDATGEMQTRTMYRGDVSAEMLDFRVGSTSFSGRWKNHKVNFVEL